MTTMIIFGKKIYNQILILINDSKTNYPKVCIISVEKKNLLGKQYLVCNKMLTLS